MEKIQSLLKNGKIYLLNLLKVVELTHRHEIKESNIPSVHNRDHILHTGIFLLNFYKVILNATKETQKVKTVECTREGFWVIE